MLDRYRDNVDWLFARVARHMSVQPHVLTALSLLFATVAGVALYYSFWHLELLVVGALAVLANGFLDGLDGKVARMQGVASLKGDFIDHAVDRFSDVLMVGGVAASPWCPPMVGLGALAGMLLTSYMGTQAQAVGYGREYGGWLGRADRVVILTLAPLVQYMLAATDITLLSWPLLAWVMAFFAVAGIITAGQRFLAVLHWFNA